MAALSGSLSGLRMAILENQGEYWGPSGHHSSQRRPVSVLEPQESVSNQGGRKMWISRRFYLSFVALTVAAAMLAGPASAGGADVDDGSAPVQAVDNATNTAAMESKTRDFTHMLLPWDWSVVRFCKNLL